MSSTWVSHGFIQSEDLEEVYQNAIASVDKYGNSSKEYHSIHLIEDLCNQVWFPGPDFKTNSRFPPSDSKGPNKASDLATQSIDERHKWHLFCFHEGKRAKNTSESKIRALENQAQGYCKEFIESHADVSLVYANTFTGGSVRFWSFTRGDKRLRGFWNGDEKDHFEYYRDVGSDDHFQQLQRAINQIKSMPTSNLRRGQSHSQIGASSFAANTISAAGSSWASSAYPAAYAGSGGSYDITYPIRDAPSGQGLNTQVREAEIEADSPALKVPDDAVQVEVKLEVLEKGLKIFHFDYEGIHYAKNPDEWQERIAYVEGKPYGCYLYIGKKSGKQFWTYLLDERVERYTVQVGVQVEVLSNGAQLYHFDYEGIHYTKDYHEWKEGKLVVKGISYDGYLYTGKKTGNLFWTQTLDKSKVKHWKGKK